MIKKIVRKILNSKHRVKRALSKNRDVWVISVPKSGRTWLRVMLEDLNIYLRYRHEESAFRSAIPYDKLETDKSHFKGRRVIFLVRDPRDTLVSGYFQVKKRMNVFDGSLSDFVQDHRFGIKKILRFHEIWNSQSNVPKGFLVVRYEDMRTNTFQEMKRILTFLKNRNIPDEKINQVIDAASFENMQKQEKEKGFDRVFSNKFGSNNPEDKESLKVRRGKVAGYFDYLNEEDIAFCNKIMNEMESPFYKTDPESEKM